MHRSLAIVLRQRHLLPRAEYLARHLEEFLFFLAKVVVHLWKRTSGATYDEGSDIYTFAKPTPPDVAVPGVSPEPDDAKAHEVRPVAI